MQSCEVIECTNWTRYGTKCHKHTTDSELVAAFARKPLGYSPDRLRGIGVVTPPRDVRYSERPNVSRVKPWSHVRGGTIALSECIVTKPDGTRHIFGEAPIRGKDTAATIRHLQDIATTADHDTHTND
jgi:hypothetical protein